MKNLKNPLWDFSLHAYADDQFSQHCLSLQDEYGLNVNILLLMMWTGFSGAKLTDDTVATVIRHAQAWQESSVIPLRDMRTRLKVDVGAITTGMSSDFREKVKELELDAERLEQDMLMEVLKKLSALNARDGDRKAVARRNLLSYLLVREVKVTEFIKEAFECLLRKAEQSFLAMEYAKNENLQQ